MRAQGKCISVLFTLYIITIYYILLYIYIYILDDHHCNANRNANDSKAEHEQNVAKNTNRLTMINNNYCVIVNFLLCHQIFNNCDRTLTLLRTISISFSLVSVFYLFTGRTTIGIIQFIEAIQYKVVRWDLNVQQKHSPEVVCLAIMLFNLC